MPPPERTGKYQDALVFAKTGYDVVGEQTVGNPTHYRVRIEFTTKQVIGSEGNPISLVAFLMIDSALTIGSILYPGTLAQWNGVGSGETDNDLYEVTTDETIPDVKGRTMEYEYGLTRYMGILPQG